VRRRDARFKKDIDPHSSDEEREKTKKYNSYEDFFNSKNYFSHLEANVASFKAEDLTKQHKALDRKGYGSKAIEPRRKKKDGEQWEQEYQYFSSTIRERVGALRNSVPETFHNRRLLPTTTDENNCAIDAIALSNNPHLTIDHRREIVETIRQYLEEELEEGSRVAHNEPIDVGKLGKVIMEVMSQKGYIRKDAGLVVHYSSIHADVFGDHRILAHTPLEKNYIHIYLESCEPIDHFWAMGPEIELGAWHPDPSTYTGVLEAKPKDPYTWDGTDSGTDSE